MKKILFFVAFSAMIFCTTEAQNLRTPAPSPTQMVKQDFALSSVELTYSRPSMKGRKIFGDLVPYNKVWRTGANGATTLNFAEDVMVGGTKVPAGKYGLLTIPGQAEWTVILSKQLDVTSPAAYKQDQDLLRLKVKADQMPFSIETFTIMFNNMKSASMELMLLWDNVAVTVPITSDVEGKVMSQINNLMNKDNRPYFSSAMYYMENGKDLNTAIKWLDKAAEQDPKAFWVYHQRANAFAKLGRKQEAIASAQKSIELAKEAKNDDYVALNEKLLSTLK